METPLDQLVVKVPGIDAYFVTKDGMERLTEVVSKGLDGKVAARFPGERLSLQELYGIEVRVVSDAMMIGIQKALDPQSEFDCD